MAQGLGKTGWKFLRNLIITLLSLEYVYANATEKYCTGCVIPVESYFFLSRGVFCVKAIFAKSSVKEKRIVKKE